LRCVLAGLLLAALAACQPETTSSALVPTLAQLPTLTPSATAPATPTPTASATSRPTSAPTASEPPTASDTPTRAATPTATRDPALIVLTRAALPTFDFRAPLEIDFDAVFPIQLEHRQPTRDALQSSRDALPPEHRWTVSAYRDTEQWAKITLVPARYVEANWAEVETIAPLVVEVVLQRMSVTRWNAYVVGSADFETIRAFVPAPFMDFDSPLPPLAGQYRFPWQRGQTWWAIQGWHDGSALDFQPAIGARFAVLAAESGRLRELCSDGYQSLLEILHGDGRATYYLHVTMGLRVRRALLDHRVERGQYLGELIAQTRFRSACGRGYSRHLHFATSDRQLIMEGMSLDALAETASCCAAPPEYVSSNERIDASENRTPT